MKRLAFCIIFFANLFFNTAIAQVFINEGSNRNYSSIADEDGEYPDWIELYNASADTIHLSNYSLTDDLANPTKWIFPNVSLLPGEYKTIFCSGKDRKPISGFIHVLNTGSYNPFIGWNTHAFSTPFYWDGVSNILINTCSYSSTGYTTNSVFNQTTTSFYSTVFAFQDGSPDICNANYGTKVSQRPNMKLNGHTIGNGVVQNSPYDYPAPYGNWYWAAKNQMLVRSSELTAAGLSAGNILNLAFNVAATDPATFYDYIDINMKLVSENEVSSTFQTVDPNRNLHTNFKISSSGETVYLFSPTQTLLDSLHVNCNNLDNSIGSFPDSSSNIVLFQTATPSATNNLSDTYLEYLPAPVFSIAPGMYTVPVSVAITNLSNGTYASDVYYTLDGSDPTPSSFLYTGAPINIYYTSVLKARSFSASFLPSPITVASYLLGVNHVTPVLSVVTDNTNLYGVNGIFDNWQYDWQKAAHVEYFDETQQLIFSQNAGIQIDGGWGGSRANPQHSFRVELDNAVLGEGHINYPLIPNRSERTHYGKFFLRNGSNQYLSFPYKDACQNEAMDGETNNYYSAWRPVTVYINGAYFGLYELREKIDDEYFEQLDGANADSIDILSQSAWGGSQLRAVAGTVDSFYTSYAAYNSLNTTDTSFWNSADHYFDMVWYNDYIIAESWMGNTDWPWNNIKIYRSDKTNYRWRFCTVDMELSMGPNGWTDCYEDHINYMQTYDPSNQYIHIWQKGIQNAKFKNYFINRFADLMNTSYRMDRILSIENSMFNQTVVEMPNEYLRWGDPNQISQQMTNFYNNHLVFQSQLSERTAQVRNNIQSDFSLAGQVDVTLNVIPDGAGKIKISTIIPDSLPWTGVYFNGNPVKITALPGPGYDFAYWDTNTVLNVQDTNISLYLNISSDAVFNAVFEPSLNAGTLSISELNYHSDSTRNAGDWIEFHNYGSGPLDMSGWRFTDSVATHDYFFPAGTILQAGDWLVLVEDTLKFHSQHPGINAFGPMGFGFSNSNESLNLYDYLNSLVLWMHYDDSIPWPQVADGWGRTLELINDTLDPALSDNWFAGCIGGSPGGPYVPCSEQIIFSEINYKSSTSADAGDWVEIHNKGALSVDISGWKFRDSDDTHNYTFKAGTILDSSGYLVLFSDSIKFADRFPFLLNITGPFTFGLGSTTDAVRLFDGSGILYQTVIYYDTPPWPQGAAGNGYTLEIVDPNGDFCDGTNWMDGCPEGSPGGPFVACDYSIPETSSENSDGVISVYPNPAHDMLHIDINDEWMQTASFSVTLYNLSGSPVYNIEQTTNSKITIINQFSPGMYFYKVTSSEGYLKTGKVMFL
jgi:hypothetical protein